MLSPLVFAIVVDVVAEHARERLLNEILYADDLVLMSESLEDLRERFQRWRSALEDKGLEVNVGKTKMMMNGTEGEVVLSKIDPCGLCRKRVGSNAVCCTVYEVDTWKLHENEKGDLQLCKTFCLQKMHRCWR